MLAQRDGQTNNKERQSYSANGPWTAEMSNIRSDSMVWLGIKMKLIKQIRLGLERYDIRQPVVDVHSSRKLSVGFQNGHQSWISSRRIPLNQLEESKYYFQCSWNMNEWLWGSPFEERMDFHRQGKGGYACCVCMQAPPGGADRLTEVVTEQKSL